MPIIKPITELRKTNEISELCNHVDEPVFITKNGYGDMVIMKNDFYEKQVAMTQIYKELLIAQREVKSGETIDAEKIFAALKEQFGHEK